MVSDAISSRTVSGFPLSIGTSLAFESVFEPIQEVLDPNRPIPQHIELGSYDEMWINVGTLFRNMYNAVERTSTKFLTAAEMANEIVAEMEQIADLVKSYSNDRVKTRFYTCSYNDLTSRFKLGSLRLPRTELQLQYSDLYENTLKILNRRSDAHQIREIVQYNSKFSSMSKKVLIMTHFPIDLLNHTKFKDLDLLESHTGILKKRPDWHTKYYDGRDLNFLPLNGILLTVFGDDHHFRPQQKAMKEAVLNLAIERKWNCLTTDREVVMGIKTMRDHALRESLLLQEQY